MAERPLLLNHFLPLIPDTSSMTPHELPPTIPPQNAPFLLRPALRRLEIRRLGICAPKSLYRASESASFLKEDFRRSENKVAEKNEEEKQKRE
jgi:hypothetical protein